MRSRVSHARMRLGRYVDDRVVRWQTGTREGQVAVLAVLLVVCLVIFALSLTNYAVFPALTFVIPLLIGSITLRFQPLLALVGVIVLLVTITVSVQYVREGITTSRVSSLVMMATVAGIQLWEARRRRSGLPGPLGEAMLVDLRDRLHAQGKVPPLPSGWYSESAMLTAGGVHFSGDFMVANLSADEVELEMILVDVCGKGVAAGTQSLQLAGALGGLIGALPPQALFAAANDFLLRQQWEEGFATAVHVSIDLRTGSYGIISAGHPPVLHWHPTTGEWAIDEARGTALGIMRHPLFTQTHGRLEPGETLLFYTDGVVESRDQGVEEGVAWLRTAATRALRAGVEGAAGRILGRVRAKDDDRAVLLVARQD
ncbi:PP2C family protein-serine/threonine phosphatase [Aeromicrobium sp.]|uniref:PP2C family protein-serine/threonine phosphatase n=1 Tax=Aeromicrobium sp. TaxID=1871063 RepID=UPI003517EC73